MTLWTLDAALRNVHIILPVQTIFMLFRLLFRGIGSPVMEKIGVLEFSHMDTSIANIALRYCP
jgi:hypothetical protein